MGEETKAEEDKVWHWLTEGLTNWTVSVYLSSTLEVSQLVVLVED